MSTRSGSAHYITNNSLYGQGWISQSDPSNPQPQQQTVDIKKTVVPTYAEVVRNMQDFRRTEKLLKNQMVAKQFGLSDPNLPKMVLSEEEKQRRKLDSKVPSKNFHVKEGEYKIPQHGMNIGLPIYETTNMQYGGLNPTSFELIEKYYPRDNRFSHQFPDMYKFDGLNTSVNFSKVHKQLNEY